MRTEQQRFSGFGLKFRLNQDQHAMLARGNPGRCACINNEPIVGVLLTRTVSSGATEAAPTSRWAASARPGSALPDGRPSRPGRDGWRASALPR